MIKANFIERLLDGAEVEWKALGEVCDIYTGGEAPENSIKDKEPNDIYKYPIYGNGAEVYGYTDSYRIDKDAVTISSIGANTGTIYFRKAFFTPIIRLKVVIPKYYNLLPRYIYHYLSSQTISSKKSSVPNMNASDVKKIYLPIPPLKVQEEIVRILDTFTELTAELTAELAARKKQYTYYRDKLLTFEEGEVEWKALGEIGEFTRGSGLQKKDFTESGIGCIHYGQIYTYYGNFAYETKSFVSPTLAKKLKKAQKDDLIIATTSENIEDVCKPLVWLGENEVCVSGEIYVFKHNQNSKYIAYYLQTPMFFDYKKQNRTGTKVIRVHGDKLAKFILPIPPLAEQERIVSILDKFDALTSSITEGLPREIELRQKQYEYYRNMLLSFPKQEG